MNSFMAEPPAVRGSRQFIGIKNQGQTCYLNAMLTVFLHTPEFKEGLLSITEENLKQLKEPEMRECFDQLQKLCVRLLLVNSNFTTADALTASFGWKESQLNQQHDVSEFYSLFYDRLSVGITKMKTESNWMDLLMKGIEVNVIKCKNCNKESKREHEFNSLMLDTQNDVRTALQSYFGSETLDGANQYECEQCESRQDAVKSLKLKQAPPILAVLLKRYTYDMYGRGGKNQSKMEYSTKLDLSDYIDSDTSECLDYDLQSVIVHQGNARQGHYISLVKDVDQLGHTQKLENSSSSPLKSINGGGKRVEITESGDGSLDVNNVCVSDEFKQRAKSLIKEPTRLIIEILMELGDNKPMNTNRLGELIRTCTNSSWGKRYKTKYGSMLRFLTTNHELFTVDQKALTVQVRDDYNIICQQQANLSLNDSSNSESSGKNPRRVSNGYGDQLLSDPTSPPSGSGFDNNNNSIGDIFDEADSKPLNWFKLSDTHVQAVTEDSLKMYFQGHSCAYMLIYRRKDLPRPEKARGFPAYRVPPHLIQYKVAEDQKLQRQRVEYDRYINTISVNVFTSSSCGLKSGLLTSRVDGGHRVLFDQRNSLQQLLQHVRVNQRKFDEGIDGETKPKTSRKTMRLTTQQHNKPDEDGKEKKVDDAQDHTTLHNVEVLPNNILALQDCLSHDPTKSLQEVGIKSDANLFVWNGSTVKGLPYRGDEHEGLVLVKMRANVSKFYRRHTHVALNKNDDMQNLISYLVKLNRGKENYALERFALCTNSFGFRQMVPTPIKKDDTSSLSTLNLDETFIIRTEPTSPNIRQRTVDNMTASSSTSSSTSSLKGDSKELITLTVINDIGECKEDSALFPDGVTEEIDVPKSWTVAQLKDLIIQSLQLKRKADSNMKKKTIQLVLDDVNGVPLLLLDHSLISNIDFAAANKTIRLEMGDKVSGDEIVVYVKSKMDELVCEPCVMKKTQLVNNLYTTVINKLKLEGTEWHLRKINCFGDFVTKYDESNKTIEEIGIRHGDFISVGQGKFLARGHVRLRAWIGPEPDKLQNIKAEELTQVLAGERIPTKYDKLASGELLNDTTQHVKVPTVLKEPVYLGTFDISRSAQVNELKGKTNNMIPDDYKNQHTSDELCCRLWSSKEGFGRILHKTADTSTLKRQLNNNNTTLNVVFYSRKMVKDSGVQTVRCLLHKPIKGGFSQQAFDLVQPKILKMSIRALVYASLRNHVTSHDDLVIARRSRDDKSWTIVGSGEKKSESSAATTSSQPTPQQQQQRSNNRNKKSKGKKKQDHRSSTANNQDLSCWTSLSDNDVIAIKIVSREDSDVIDINHFAEL